MEKIILHGLTSSWTGIVGAIISAVFYFMITKTLENYPKKDDLEKFGESISEELNKHKEYASDKSLNLEKKILDCYDMIQKYYITEIKLETRISNLMKDVEHKFASKESVENVDNKYEAIDNKLEKIYEHLISLNKK